jgi:hypothetical protein
MPHFFIVPDNPGYDQVFKSRGGVVGRDIHRRAQRVRSAAIVQAGKKTNALRSDMKVKWMPSSSSGDLRIQVGSDVRHAQAHHEGTRPHIIRARNAKALRFINSAGEVVFAQSVHHPGTRPNRYLTDNLPLAVQ